eukprot:scaffold30_cov255-Pinguiococcus_pyrenoidosus.AAC.19
MVKLGKHFKGASVVEYVGPNVEGDGADDGEPLELKPATEMLAAPAAPLPRRVKVLEVEQLRLAEQEQRRLLGLLAAEKEFSRSKGLECKTRFRQLLRNEKLSALHGALSIIQAEHEEAVARTQARLADAVPPRKDRVLDALFLTLGEADHQHGSSVMSHLVHLDRLIQLHEHRLRELEEAFDKELHSVSDEHSVLVASMERVHNKDVHELEAVVAEINEAEYHCTLQMQVAHSQSLSGLPNEEQERLIRRAHPLADGA